MEKSENKPVIYALTAFFIFVSGFLARILASNFGVVNCKGLTGGPLFAVNALILLVLLYFIRSKGLGKNAQLAYTIVLSAGIGNLTDEVLNKCVLDYFSLFGVYFNVFEVFICIGLFILGFTYTTKKVK